MCFKREGAISTVNGRPLELVNIFTYLGSNISSTESNVNIRLAKACTAIDRLLIIWKSDRSSKIKRYFFRAVAVSILLYGCTIWILTKRVEKKVDRKSTRFATSYLEQILEANPHETTTARPLSISKTISVRRTRYAGHS